MSRLSFLQSIYRHIALLGGSYTHPDGSIELDVEAAAGIDHYRDGDDLKKAKMERHWARQARGTRVVAALSVGVGVYLLTRPDADTWRTLMGTMLVSIGAYQVSR